MDFLDFDLLDLMKVWLEDCFLLIEVGIMMLNCNLKNFFVEVE